MKSMKKAILYLALTLAAVLSFSCKKDNSTTSAVYLEGLYIEEDPVPYVGVDTPVILTANISSMYLSDGSTLKDPIGIYWCVNGGDRDTLTLDASKSNPSFLYVGEETGEVSITCYAFAGNYYNASYTVSYSIIDPDTSLSGLSGETTIIDGNKFYVSFINGENWLACNLYGTESGISYHLADITDSILGKFYTWEEALTACPEGWELPSAEQWDSLGDDACSLMADATLLEKQMWTYWPNMQISNAKVFNAIPAGYVDLTGGDTNVQGFNNYAVFWTRSEAEKEGQAQYRYIYADQNDVQSGSGSKTSLALSVRCIKK